MLTNSKGLLSTSNDDGCWRRKETQLWPFWDRPRYTIYSTMDAQSACSSIHSSNFIQLTKLQANLRKASSHIIFPFNRNDICDDRGAVLSYSCCLASYSWKIKAYRIYNSNIAGFRFFALVLRIFVFLFCLFVTISLFLGRRERSAWDVLGLV